jgi:FAD/FMN-containing dehydrogenase
MIAEAVRERAARSEVVDNIRSGEVKHVVPLHDSGRYRQPSLNLGGLDQVIQIDVENRVCVAESAVPFWRIVQATLARGLLPKVVPELKGITLGGAVVGCSVESMSFRYGGFHDTCLEYELITGSGDIITCSREEEPDVFEMVHGSYGTLALLTRLTFELIPASRCVHLSYRTFTSSDSFLSELHRQVADGSADFIDAIVHAPDRFVLCLGEFVDEAPYVSDVRSNVYYASTAARDEDYLTTEDYCFRYDADCHWMTRAVPPLQWGPVRRLAGRRLLGSTNLIRLSRLQAMVSRKRRPDVVCDIFVPSQRFLEFFDWYSREFCFYPLWVVPYRPPRDYPWISEEFIQRAGDDLYIDCAIYGRDNNEPDRDYSQILEDKVFEIGGLKTLIGRNSYTPERFWTIYHQRNWQDAKARLDPQGLLPELYEHVGQTGTGSPKNR